jgi:GT2 family glycosyltransferase
MTKRITVGLPVYRAAKYIPAALTCLQQQTFREFDAIISVDGEDRETADACRPFLSDPRFRMAIQTKRLDWFGNFNWLLQQDLNEFFCYRQHDDTTSPDFFEKLIKLADSRSDAAAIYCDRQWTGGRDDIESFPSIEGGRLERMLQQLEHLPVVSVRGLIRREAIRQAGLVRADEFRALCEILVWLTKVLRWGAFIRLPEPLYYRLDHADNFHKDHTSWPEERRRAAWTTMFTGMLEAIMPACETPNEKLHVQQLILDRVTVSRPDRNYLNLPPGLDSAGRFIGECLDRLRHEGNLHLLGSDELPTFLQSRFRHDFHTETLNARLRQSEITISTLKVERDMAERERRRLEAELALIKRSRALKFTRRMRRLLGLPLTEG